LHTEVKGTFETIVPIDETAWREPVEERKKKIHAKIGEDNEQESLGPAELEQRMVEILFKRAGSVMTNNFDGCRSHSMVLERCLT
jgi:hypothetical protein